MPRKKKRTRPLNVDVEEIDDIAHLLDTLNHENVFETEQERSMWQTLKKKVRRVLEITDGVVNDIQAKADLEQKVTAREQTQGSDREQYES